MTRDLSTPEQQLIEVVDGWKEISFDHAAQGEYDIFSIDAPQK